MLYCCTRTAPPISYHAIPCRWFRHPRSKSYARVLGASLSDRTEVKTIACRSRQEAGHEAAGDMRNGLSQFLYRQAFVSTARPQSLDGALIPSLVSCRSSAQYRSFPPGLSVVSHMWCQSHVTSRLSWYNATDNARHAHGHDTVRTAPPHRRTRCTPLAPQLTKMCECQCATIERSNGTL